MLSVHTLADLYPHSSNYAHAVEIGPGARLLFSNGQVATRPDGTTPIDIREQAEVVFERLSAILDAADMRWTDVVRFNTYLTAAAYQDAYKSVRDRIMGDHRPAATLLVVAALARPELKIEVEIIAARTA